MGFSLFEREGAAHQDLAQERCLPCPLHCAVHLILPNALNCPHHSVCFAGGWHSGAPSRVSGRVINWTITARSHLECKLDDRVSRWIDQFSSVPVAARGECDSGSSSALHPRRLDLSVRERCGGASLKYGCACCCAATIDSRTVEPHMLKQQHARGFTHVRHAHAQRNMETTCVRSCAAFTTSTTYPTNFPRSWNAAVCRLHE